MEKERPVNLALPAAGCGRRIGTQSVKVLLVRMCLCLVGTHESMFSCMNKCLCSIGMCVHLLGWYK